MHPRICKLAIPSKTAIDNPWYFCFDADNCFMTWKLAIIAVVIKLFYSFYERINNPFLRTLWTYTNLSFVGLYLGFEYKKLNVWKFLFENIFFHKADWYYFVRKLNLNLCSFILLLISLRSNDSLSWNSNYDAFHN